MALQQKLQADSSHAKMPPPSRAFSPPRTNTPAVRPATKTSEQSSSAQRARTSIAMQKGVGNIRAERMIREPTNRAGTALQVSAPAREEQPLSLRPQAKTFEPQARPAEKTLTALFAATPAGKDERPPAETTAASADKSASAPRTEAAKEETAAASTAVKTKAEPVTAATETRAEAPAKAEPAAKTAAETGTKSPAKGEAEKKSTADAARGKSEKGEEAETKPPSPREAIAPTIHAVHHRAAKSAKHPDPEKSVASAESAAKKPETERTRSAAKNTVGTLATAEKTTNKMDRGAFKKAVKEAIDRVTTPQPTTKSDADRVMKKAAGEANTAVRGDLTKQRDTAAGTMKTATDHDASASAEDVPVETALKPEQVGPPPAPISAAPIVPAPLPAEKLDYSSDREPTDKAMAESGVSKESLAEGNEPEFSKTLDSRADAEKHEAEAEGRYRQMESREQDHTHNAARKELGKGLGDIHDVRSLKVGSVAGQQTQTKEDDAAARDRITNDIEGFKNQTKQDVKDLLDAMEKGAATIFDAGLKHAEEEYQRKFKEEKGGLWNWATNWGDDWEELIENSLKAARRTYMECVDASIDEVANFVDQKLEAARVRVDRGREQVDNYVGRLDAKVRHFGDDARAAVTKDFDDLVSEIDQHRDALVDKLAKQYKSSFERMCAMEEKLREENKSLWQKIYDATVGLIKKILAFKDMLVSILSKAASVVVDIIAHPIRFLGNLIDGVMLGMKNFKANLGTHLKKGLMEWIFGELGGAGLQLPETFDLQGILSIILQVLGLTYANFRARAVAIVGEPVVSAIEKTAEVFKVILTEGVPGLWRFIKDKLSDLKSMVMDAILDFIKERVIVAGITWIIGLLNPASAFFKACKAIYDIVMFFINHGSQIIALVNAIIDSIAAIAKGSIEVAAKWVETALAKAIPVAIGFLASLLGLGDIGSTVKKIIDKAQEPVNKAIDWVINLAVKGVKAVGGMLGIGKKDDPKSKGLSHIGKEVEWTGDKPHILWLEVKNDEPVVMMASGKGRSLSEVLSEYRKSANKLKDETKKKKALENLAKADALLPLIGTLAKQEVELTKQPDSKMDQLAKKEKEVESDEDKLASSIREVQLAISLKPLPPTMVKQTGGSKGDTVTAEPLSKIPGNTHGSSPHESPPGWDIVQSHDRDSKDESVKHWSTRYMKQMHLLSEKLHGPGVAWNLVPGQQKANTEMERKVESDAKDRMDADEVLTYKAKVEYYPSPIEDFPDKIHLSWCGLEEQPDKPGEWKPVGTPMTETIEPEKPPYGGGPVQASLSTMSRAALTDRGIPAWLARQINQEASVRRFDGLDDFQKRMSERYGRHVNFDDADHWGLVSIVMTKHNLTF